MNGKTRLAKSLSLTLGILLVMTIACLNAFGQSGTSTVRGTVSDPQGNVVAGAVVTLSNVEKSFNRTAVTNTDGGYVFSLVPPGAYTVQTEAKGFKKAVASNVKAQVNTPTELDVRLEVGNVTETVNITSGAEAPLNTSDATIGNTFTNKHISQLPLEARNVAGLLSLQPGVTFFGNLDPQGATTDYRNGSVNGGKSDQANVTLDGVDVNDQQSQTAFTSVLRVTLDSVQEFRVTTTNPNAEQGRSSGAQVGLVTKSGTNDWHGSIYESHRNTIFAANNYFNNRAGVFGPNDFAVIAGSAKVGQQKVPRSKLLRNVFGGSLGGPIIKDRAFFFLNYEGRRDAREESAIRVVPSDDLRQGIFHYLKSGNSTIFTLSPADVLALDPLHIGASPGVLAIFQKYPHPNSDEVGDKLNTFGFRFNAPIHLRWNTYTARLDYNVTRNGKHSVFWRGVLQNDKDNSAQQFPGEPANFVNLTNNKGFAAGYTAVISPTLTSHFVYGFTRQGFENSGSTPGVPIVSFRSIDDLHAVARNFRRISPVHNFVEDLSWIRGTHTLQFGANIRYITNGSVSQQNSFPSAITNKAWLLSARPLRPAGATSAGDHAMAALLGLVDQGTAIYNYDKSGTALAVGAPVKRDFAAREYETYGQDSWRVRPNLTITFGLRYSLYSPPYEKNGNQVAPAIRLGDWFTLRGTNAAKGIPSNAAPRITFDLAGPVNHKRGFYDWDKNNFGPRFSIAYSPDWKSGFISKLTGGPGKMSIRAGYGIVYDRVGASLATAFDRTNAFGLSTRLTNSAGVLTPSTSPRFVGPNTIPSSLLLPDPGSHFPATPGADFAITAAIDDNLRTPYSEQIDFSIQRELPKGITIEGAYVGRLGKHILVLNDLAMPVNLKDPVSGMDYFTAANLLLNYSTQAAVPKIPFWETFWPNLASGGLTSSQVAWSYYNVNSPTTSGPDYTTSLFRLDVACTPGVTCSKFGPFAIFNDQYSNLNAWSSLMPTWYHAAQLLIRKRFSAGTQFDFNYTFSKSEDWASVVERNGLFAGSVLNSWNPWLRKDVSDYDVTHNLNVNGIAELPLGKGKKFGSNMPGWANAVLGGWQISGIWRWTSGLPTSIGNGFQFPTNWEFTGNATAISPIPGVQTTKGPDGPNIFKDPAAAFAAFSTTRPGGTGGRNIIRGDGYFSIDTGLSKSWTMPYNEKHSLQFRWEVFNLTNTARFDVNQSSGNMDNAGTFGRYSGTLTQPRVMQFGLRYEFQTFDLARVRLHDRFGLRLPLSPFSLWLSYNTTPIFSFSTFELRRSAMFRANKQRATSSTIFVVKRSSIWTIIVALTLSIAINGQVGGGHLVFGDFKVSESKDGKSTPQVFNVILYSVFGSVVARQTVTNHGRYQFYNVNNGEYDIVVEVESQEVARTHVVLTSSLRSDFRYDISLEWRAGAGNKKRTATVSAEDLYDRRQPNKDRYQKAEEAFENKKYDQAVALFRQIVADDPADFQAWSELGTVYLAEKKNSDAEAAYVHALSAHPKFFLALMNLGKLSLATKNFEGAIEPLTQAIAIKPSSAEANYFLGEAYLQIKKGSKAVGYLYEALKIDPIGMAEAHLRLAALYNAAGMKDKAAAEYEQFLEKRPDYADKKKLQKYISDNKKP